MATRVYELAKELNMSNKDMIDKLNNMGINVSSHMNALSDIDCTAVRNHIKNSSKSKETKIVKVPVKNDTDQTQEKKAVSVNPSETATKKENAVKKEPAEKRTAPEKNTGASKQPANTNRPTNSAGSNQKNTAGNPQRTAPGTQSSNTQNRSSQSQQTARNNNTQGTQKNFNNNTRNNNRPNTADKRNNQNSSGTQKNANDQRRSNNANQNNRSDSSKKSPQSNNNNQNRRNSNNQRNTNNQQQSNNPPRRRIDMTKPQHAHKKDVRKEQRKEAAKQAEIEAMEIPTGAIVVTVPITVKGLSEQIEVSTSQIIMSLMKMGIMANINQNLDEDLVLILADELNKQIIIGKVEEEELEDGIEDFEDREEDLKPRPPIITVMGHVDHGKTSLLDKIRNSSVTTSESGGITQHIGASEITYNNQRIVFLDTPGHEAFTAMRARGAYVTDIAVLVVAADDSVKPQTIEAINHAKAANVPIIVAINKIDKPGANVDMVKKDLAEHDVLIEEWGGTVIAVPVSAKTGEGIDSLLEMILLQAEVLELKANPSRLALGTVIEARLDKQRGPVATLLVLNGTLHAGMSIVAGNCSGKIKAMTNFRGETLKKAGPATAVEILGLADVPEAGDQFNAVSSDKVAREIAENRKLKQREQVMQKSAGTTLEQLFSQIEQGDVKELNLIIKADVQGSVGALVTSLEKLTNENVAVKIIHTGVGTITESDIMLASTTGAIIIGFNVRPNNSIIAQAQRDGVEIRTYSVIYEAIEEVESALKGMLDPEYKEEVLGTIEVRNTFKVPNVGIIAGAYVLEGKVERNAQIRLVRDGIVIHEGQISSLKRYKDDAKEVSHGFECGIGLANYNDIKEGDIIEAFKMVEIERK